MLEKDVLKLFSKRLVVEIPVPAAPLPSELARLVQIMRAKGERAQWQMRKAA